DRQRAVVECHAHGALARAAAEHALVPPPWVSTAAAVGRALAVDAAARGQLGVTALGAADSAVRHGARIGWRARGLEPTEAAPRALLPARPAPGKPPRPR